MWSLSRTCMQNLFLKNQGKVASRDATSICCDQLVFILLKILCTLSLIRLINLYPLSMICPCNLSLLTYTDCLWWLSKPKNVHYSSIQSFYIVEPSSISSLSLKSQLTDINIINLTYLFYLIQNNLYLVTFGCLLVPIY